METKFEIPKIIAKIKTPTLQAKVAPLTATGGSGTRNYIDLLNKPSINGEVLIGNKTSKDLKLQDEMKSLSNTDIQEILNS